MKKTLSTVALSTVLILGMAAGAMAESAVSAAGAANLTIDGSVRQRGVMDKNDATKDSGASSYYDGRVRLGVKAQVADQVTGYVQIETGTASNDNYNWGNGTSAGLHTGGNKDVGDLTIVQSWVQYNAADFTIKAGHMPLALGNKVFFDHADSGDDAVMAYKAMGDTFLAGILIKFDEQAIGDATDDLDGYVGLLTHKFSDNLDGGVNWTYLKGGSTDEALANGMSMSDIGINANYRQDNLSFLADVEFQFGDFSDDGVTTMDASGWAVKLGADMDLGAAKVGLLYGYGSGDDNATDNDVDNFINFLSDTNYDTIIANYRANVPGTFTKYSGLSNLSEYQINVSTKTTCALTGKDLSLFASATYMQLNEDITVSGKQEDNVGTELDAVATWSLAPGLAYKVEAAYLFTDDVWGTDADNLYFLRHALELSF